MEKPIRTADPERVTNLTADAAPCVASWDVFYQDALGLECHLQLKGASLDALLDQAKSAAMAISEAGGLPSRRVCGSDKSVEKPRADKPKENGSGGNGTNREPTYADERGGRRCNRLVADGSVCGRPVTEREGRYGTFWSCPNYKAHAPNGAH